MERAMTRHSHGEEESVRELRCWAWYWDRLIYRKRHPACARYRSAPRTGMRTRARHCTRRTASSAMAREGPDAGDPEPPGGTGGRLDNELTGLLEGFAGSAFTTVLNCVAHSIRENLVAQPAVEHERLAASAGVGLIEMAFGGSQDEGTG